MDILQTWPRWPIYGRAEYKAVKRVIRSNQLFAANEVRKFEDEFSAFLGSSHCIGVGNATQGLHLALIAAEVGEGDEVIVTNCSWISTASCILMQNAIPVFVDIEPDSFGLDPFLLDQALSPRTKAIIAVHILGYPSKIDQVRNFAAKHNLVLIEDASHAPGAKLNGENLGKFGHISVFSLHQRKAISTGDGGIVCTDNFSFAQKIRRLRSFGDIELSYNYRMTEFSAALAQIGLKKLEKENTLREISAVQLKKLLEDDEWVKVRLSGPNQKGVYYAIALEINLTDQKSDELLQYFLNRKVPMRKLFSPLNRHPHFSNFPKPSRGLPWQHPSYLGSMKKVEYSSLDFPVANEYCNGRVLELYTYPGTTIRHLQAFVHELRLVYHKISLGNTRPLWN